MNNETFQQARSAYVSKQFDVALAKFTECLEDTSVEKAPGEVGLLYHQIGNCLVKLKDPNEAIHAYSQALVDTSYDASGSVSYNLGMVYASQGDFEDAITNFKAVTEDSRYATPYKAYVALGNSLLKLGKSAEAGAAFRAAALDESNPDPTKALLNLGVCFMALDRPMDAIASYESALQFDMKPETRNKIFANMGQAYVADGKMEKAVRAFESALADKTYVFNDAANVDYQRAVAAVAAGNTGEVEAVTPEELASTSTHNDLSGLDVQGDGVPIGSSRLDPSEMGTMQLSETSIMREIAAAEQAGSQYFQEAEQDFQDWGQPLKKKRRHRGLKAFLIILILIIIVAGGGAFAYTQGYGMPSQQDQVNACLPILKMQMCMPLALMKAKKPVLPIRLPRVARLPSTAPPTTLAPLRCTQLQPLRRVAKCRTRSPWYAMAWAGRFPACRFPSPASLNPIRSGVRPVSYRQ